MSGTATTFYAGDTFLRTWQFSSTSGAYDLTNCSASYGLVPAAGGASGSFQTKTTDQGGYLTLSTPASLGTVSLSVPADVTRQWAAGTYTGAIKLTFTDGTSVTEALETITVNPMVANV